MIVLASRDSVLRLVGVGLLILCALVYPAIAQNADQGPPLLTAGAVPLYPRLALVARIQGIVKIRVTTDGRRVSSLDSESGPPMLVNAAKENIQTWEFEEHKPTTFETTFKYVIEGPDQCEFSNGASVLNLPLEIRISAKGLKTCDPVTEIKLHP